MGCASEPTLRPQAGPARGHEGIKGREARGNRTVKRTFVSVTLAGGGL